MIRPPLFGFLVLAVAVNAAHAQDLPGISQQSFVTEIIGNLTRLTGEVEIRTDDWSFHADQVDILTDEVTNTPRLVASGNVSFTSEEGGRIAADRVEFDIDTVTGTFYGSPARGTTRLIEDIEPSMFGTQEPEIRFWGEVLEKVGPRTYRLTNGGFTSCVQPTPRWEVSVSSATINLEEYALLRNMVLRVKGVPMFYLPAMYYPIQEDGRATGILMPTYGASTIRGQSISNAFFLAINRSHDATVFHDWFTATGQGFGAEYRYVFGPGSRGNAETYLLDEHETTVVDQFGETIIPGRRSYQLRGNAQHRISNALTARGQIDYFSDVTVQQTYQTNIYDASNSSRSFGGNVTGSWGAYTFSGTGDISETFFGDTNATLYGAGPRVSFNQAERSLLGSPVYFAFTSEYANLLRRSRFEVGEEVESGLQRIDVNPLIRLPITRWPFLTLNTSVGWRQTFWTESFDEMTGEQVQTPITRSFVELQTQITGPVLVKVWDTPNSGFSERMKHVIEPWVNLGRTSAIDNFDQIVQLEGSDFTVGNVTQIRYGLNNRLYAKRAEGEGPAVSREILTVSVQQSYYTDANAAQYDRQFQTSFQGGDNLSNFSPVSLLARVDLTGELSGTLRAEYDTQFGALRTIGADANLATRGWFNQTIGWSQRRFVEGLAGFDDPDRLAHYVNSFTNLRLRGNRIGGFYEFNYDIQLGRFLQQRVLAYYNAQCCGISVEFQSYNLEGLGSLVRVDHDRRFNLSFTLAGLGTFSNMLGAFGVGAGQQ